MKRVRVYLKSGATIGVFCRDFRVTYGADCSVTKYEVVGADDRTQRVVFIKPDEIVAVVKDVPRFGPSR